MPQPGYGGWGKLGEILGGGAGTPGAYEKQLGLAYDTQGKGYSRDKAMEEAARARNINIARGGLGEKLASILGDEQGGLVNAILQGNTTMNIRQAGGYARPGYLEAGNVVARGVLGDPEPVEVPGSALGEDEAYARSLGIAVPELGEIPDAAAINRATALMTGKQYQPTIVQGGAYMANGADILGGDEYIPTLPTMTDQTRTESAIAQGQQRTDAAVAKSGRAPASSGHGGKLATTSATEGAELARARSAVQNGADPGQVADLLRRRGFPGLAKKIYAPGGG